MQEYAYYFEVTHYKSLLKQKTLQNREFITKTYNAANQQIHYQDKYTYT